MIGPGVVKRGRRRPASFTRSKVSTTVIGLSIAVPQTSPSPWAAWVSPTENKAPATSTGRYSVAADGEVADVHVAADPARRHDAVQPGLGRRDADRAGETA